MFSITDNERLRDAYRLRHIFRPVENVRNINAKFPVARHCAFRCRQDDGDVLQNAGHGILLPKGNGGQVVCRYQVVAHKNHLILSDIPTKKRLR